MIDIGERGRGRSRLHAGSPTQTRSWDSRIMPWTKGRCQTAEPPRDPRPSGFYSAPGLLGNTKKLEVVDSEWFYVRSK